MHPSLTERQLSPPTPIPMSASSALDPTTSFIISHSDSAQTTSPSLSSPSTVSHDAVLDSTVAPASQPGNLALDQQLHRDIRLEGTEPMLNGVNSTIELVDHNPGTITIEEAGNVVEETNDWIQECDSMKRVKVCNLHSMLGISSNHLWTRCTSL